MYEAEDLNKQKGFIVPNYGKWRKRFTNAQIKKVEDIAGETLLNLGYEVMFNAGNKDIGNLKLFFLRWLDRMYSFFIFFNSKRKYSLYHIGTAIKRSLQQNKYYKY